MSNIVKLAIISGLGYAFNLGGAALRPAETYCRDDLDLAMWGIALPIWLVIMGVIAYFVVTRDREIKEYPRGQKIAGAIFIGGLAAMFMASFSGNYLLQLNTLGEQETVLVEGEIDSWSKWDSNREDVHVVFTLKNPITAEKTRFKIPHAASQRWRTSNSGEYSVEMQKGMLGIRYTPWEEEEFREWP